MVPSRWATMRARLIIVGAAVVAAIVVGLTVLRTEPPRPTPPPTAAASPARPPTPTATAPAVTTRPPSPSRTLPPAAASCAPRDGGALAHQTQLVAVRVAHQSGFDRIVFELGPSSVGIGSYGMPPWHVGQAAEFMNTAGQPIAVAGNAFLQVRISGTSTFQPDSPTKSYSGSTDLRPETPLVRNLRLVEDFERQVTWGIGLERLQCPRVLELTAPVRLVLDLPSAP